MVVLFRQWWSQRAIGLFGVLLEKMTKDLVEQAAARAAADEEPMDG